MTIDSIFECCTCHRTRQYGNAYALRNLPDNLSARIGCVQCGPSTLHTFLRNEIRSQEREKAIQAEMHHWGPKEIETGL